jgi:hypothetical protein
MATIVAARQTIPHEGPAVVWLWETLTATDNVGSRVLCGHRPGKSVHVVGTFGGAVTLRGSNLPDPDVTTAAHWFALTDPTQTTISLTAAGLKEVLESCLWVSPAAAVGVTDVDVYLLLTSARSRS